MISFTIFRDTLWLLLPLIFSASVTASSGHARFHHHPGRALAKRDVAVSGSLPSGWSSLGCYTDNVNSRGLYQATTSSQSMTEEFCISFCNTNGYVYAGVEYSDECYCGNLLAASAKTTSASDCNMACAGNATEACGAGNRLNVFVLTSAVSSRAPTVQNAGPPGWGFLGCYVDSVAARTLPGNGQSEGGSSKLTNALCTQACQNQGFLYAGTEYSGECWCGNTLNNTMLAPDGFAGCDMVCNGNATEFCGGPNRLDVFGYGQPSTIIPAWSPVGCYTDTVQARTLRYAVAVPGGPSNMTQGNCQTACHASGYGLAGVEYSQECWCDNAYQGAGGPAPDGDTGCNMACSGDPSTICGGPNRLTAFQYTAGSAPSSSSAAVPPATSTNAAPSSSVATTATSTTALAGSTGLPGNFTYRGCYVDNTYGRILNQQPDNSALTVQSCIATCQGLGDSIAGMEYSTQCFCGNAMVNGGVLAQQDTDCNMPCGGNATQNCGAGNRMSIYATGNFSSYAAPKAYNTSLPGNWTYQGCLSDNAQPRTFPYQIDLNANLTVPNCLNLCHQFGYSAASMEYGQQCFCGDDTDRVNAGVTFIADNQCNTPCPGQPEALCGGANAMNYYTWNNVNVWHQAVGNAAGEYDFLIGGLIVPLISQVGINGKVTFVEKRGTGPPNSTVGSYELDLSQINNFNAAWRPLNGLKTDVFCSAGLTLPDKAGRMINIGGWSAESLFGVRFYSPDGSPGVPGVNGWQESVGEVALQKGRWYPSAVQLVNGSILVVGGEDGSNGAPVPNLEVIPRPPGGPVLYMDWLDRTDPNNLYPFLTVLPTGNIAVFYYNEARILDENTFQTVRTLPNIPGSVTRPDGGRTYPLEGTAMLLPQSAPYTDPLEVLICGGSTPYQGFALDNCVSIQPENPSANWVIERMPDKRVISCMTALPDGTYLILNGAHQGAAGFGLASDPNHMAVLYDPSLPRNQRMTRMANSTIDRLYHSEAVLLLDGRVLVSGSDPEDNVHAQEYRLEVFIPPYLMGNLGASRPAYTIVNNHTDWAYGESITITMTSGTASKISLMRAVSSTHGNSMGQRTIFPAFSCSGSTCTITAPPNGYIAGGPGWHMLFVLNSAGTPSIAQWVRIGGDPAGLGNWPNFPDFTLPGV